MQRIIENQNRLRRHSGMRQRRRGTDGTPVAPAGGRQGRWAEKDFVPRREVTAIRLRTHAARLRTFQEEIVEGPQQSRAKITVVKFYL